MKLSKRSIFTLGVALTHFTAAFAGSYAGNPYSPTYKHEYRHGVVPAVETWQAMQTYLDRTQGSVRSKAAGANGAAAGGTNILQYWGSYDAIGVTSGKPKVYLVFYGRQWLTGGDPLGAAQYLQNLFKGLGTGGELWSGTMTQYCDGPLVHAGDTACPAAARFVKYPEGGALAGVWFDNSIAAPANATQYQLAQEAIRAAAHFGNGTFDANRYAQYIVVSPSGTHPDGFPGSGFCAWHSFRGSSYGDIAYTNMPYVGDVGPNCYGNRINGPLDGFSVVAGHEYAETLTDQDLFGWRRASDGSEDGDECVPPYGVIANVAMGNGIYAMQAIWSNDTIRCDIWHPVVTSSGQVSGDPAKAALLIPVIEEILQ